jgi:hypothetical protein
MLTEETLEGYESFFNQTFDEKLKNVKYNKIDEFNNNQKIKNDLYL